jgi:hypothetical protein
MRGVGANIIGIVDREPGGSPRLVGGACGRAPYGATRAPVESQSRRPRRGAVVPNVPNELAHRAAAPERSGRTGPDRRPPAEDWANTGGGTLGHEQQADRRSVRDRRKRNRRGCGPPGRRAVTEPRRRYRAGSRSRSIIEGRTHVMPAANRTRRSRGCRPASAMRTVWPARRLVAELRAAMDELRRWSPSNSR